MATSSGNGVLTVPVGGEAAFVIKAKNAGKLADPLTTVSTSHASLPVEVTLCETNASTGACLHTPAESVTLSSLPSQAVRTFAVFVTASGSIANDPSKNRIYVLFKTSGFVEGSGSVAVTTK